MSGRMRWDRPKAVTGGTDGAMPFRKAPSDRAPRKQVRRCAELAAAEGIAPPTPAGEYLTKQEAGRFIDGVLIARAKRERGG